MQASWIILKVALYAEEEEEDPDEEEEESATGRRRHENRAGPDDHYQHRRRQQQQVHARARKKKIGEGYDIVTECVAVLTPGRSLLLISSTHQPPLTSPPTSPTACRHARPHTRRRRGHLSHVSTPLLPHPTHGPFPPHHSCPPPMARL